jgi:hypothetical protein
MKRSSYNFHLYLDQIRVLHLREMLELQIKQVTLQV